MRLLLLTLLTCSLVACDGNTAARKAARGEHFVAEPNKIFFNNTRVRDYRTDDARQGTSVHRHADLLGSDAPLVPVIVHNWLADRASVRFELRQGPQSEPLPRPFRLDLERRGSWQTLALTVPPTTEELTRLRTHLATRRNVRIVMGPDTLNPFPGDTRDYAREAIDDYLALVGH